MHRGTYSKIPVVMGDYDTDLGKEKEPRSWYSNNNGRLYFVDLNGNVIDVWDAIIGEHEKEGNHERFWTDSPITLVLRQQRSSNKTNPPTELASVEIHGSHNGRYGTDAGNVPSRYYLTLDSALSLGLNGTGPIINIQNSVPEVVNVLPIEYGGTGVKTFIAGSEFIQTNSKADKLLTSGYKPYWLTDYKDLVRHSEKYEGNEGDGNTLVNYSFLISCFDELSDDIKDINDDIGNMVDISNIGTKRTITDAIETINNSIKGIKTDIGNSDISNIDEDTESIKGAIVALNKRINALSTAIDNINYNLSTAITSINGSINGIKTDIGITDISNIGNGTIKGAISTLNTLIGGCALKTDVDDLEAEITKKDYLPTARMSSFVSSLPSKIVDMIFPTCKFNGVSGVRILQISLAGANSNTWGKELKLTINANTGYGMSPDGSSGQYHSYYGRDLVAGAVKGIDDNGNYGGSQGWVSGSANKTTGGKLISDVESTNVKRERNDLYVSYGDKGEKKDDVTQKNYKTDYLTF